MQLHQPSAPRLHELRRVRLLSIAGAAFTFMSSCLTLGGSLPPAPMVSGPDGSERIQVIFPAPIPVGHRVEVQWYRSERHAHPYEPVIRDLDTGIVYQTDWVLDTAGVLRPGMPLKTSENIRTDVQKQEVLTGRVAACRVLFIPWASTPAMQTELTIIPEQAPQPPPQATKEKNSSSPDGH